jgi:uncharacterized protein (DUF433 family)
MRPAHPNPLAKGFYTVPEAARLIRVGSARRIYGWLRGYPRSQTGPLLTRDYYPIGEHEELSFLDLMEVRFVEHFREYGCKLSSLRKAAETLRSEFNTEHPFAYKPFLLVADKADVFVKEVLRKSAEETGDIRLRSLTSNNYVMYDTIKQSLLPGVTFDAATELVAKWAPLPEKFPEVLLDPRIAYGQPALPSGIPTGTLADAWRAEGGNADTVAYWFKVSSKDILNAVRFETALDEHGSRKAA